MNFDTVLDYAQFQLSPRRTRCELFISGGGSCEKLASGFLKPFLIHLKVAEEQVNQAVPSIKLQLERQKNAATWFNKGTLERFVRFVSTPEILELANTYDAEMSQLEGARKIYSQGAGDQRSGEIGSAAAAAADVTKKELLKAIDVRLTAVKQDLATACARASAAGFTPDTVSELLLFAEQFGAFRLKESCTKFISLCQRWPELVTRRQSPSPLLRPQWKGFDDANVRSSSSSDMSIDEPELEPSGQSRPFICENSSTGLKAYTHSQLSQKNVTELQSSVHPLVEKDTSKAKEDPPSSVLQSTDPVQPVAGGSRRLSVQDRINLFESKQKEQSAVASTVSSSSGGGGTNRIVAGKGEHRRQASDASMEKSVLRRWSGASDMSIDLTNNSFSSDRKEGELVAKTPSSSTSSHDQYGSKTERAGTMKDTATSGPTSGPKENSAIMSSSSSLSSSQAQTISFTRDRDRSDNNLSRGAGRASETHSGPSLEKGHGDSIKQSGTSVFRENQQGFGDEINTHASSESSSKSGVAKLKDPTMSLDQFDVAAMQHAPIKKQAPSQLPPVMSAKLLQKGEPKEQALVDAAGVRGPAPSRINRTVAGKPEDSGAKAKVQLDSQFESKCSLLKADDTSGQNNLSSQLQGKTCLVREEGWGKEEAPVSHALLSDTLEDGSGSQKMQLHSRAYTIDQAKKVRGRRDERGPNQGANAPISLMKRADEREDVSQLPSTAPVKQAFTARPLKANADLQMKADELEKLFAAHKLRVHGDQTASSRRSKTTDDQALKSAGKSLGEVLPDQLSKGNIPAEILSNGVEFDTNLLRMVDNLNSVNNTKQKLDSLSPSDDSRGKMYEMYRQKRDAKLREEWASKKAQKEAKMKAMQDTLDRSQAEMNAKLAGSFGRRDSNLTRYRAEKIRSFNAYSATKNQGQAIDRADSQELEEVLYGQERSYSDTLSGNESSTSSKKLLSSKSLSSSTPKTSAAPNRKPSAKATNYGTMQRRTQIDNPLAQSVPNFSDLRKENTKPVTGLSKGTSHSQLKTFARSRTAAGEPHLAKEEKSQRFHSMRKSSAVAGELKDLTPFSSDDGHLTPLNFSKEQLEQSGNKFQNSEPKPFLRKGKGRNVGPGAGAGVARLRASMNPESLNYEEESEVLMEQQEDSLHMLKDDEFDGATAEGSLQTRDAPVDLDSEDDNPGTENGDALRSQLQDVEDSMAVSSEFNTSEGNMQDTLGEGPGPWNPNHSFSYAHDASDVDASVDSPIGSPMSWSSHPLNQMMEADAARMRKKWGTAQIPVIAASAPHHPRKDVTKGIKRLLKFGRKSKGSEYLVNDWVSASTTSEGDDDTEDGRELGSRISDELRKSRMGNSTPSYERYNDGDSFPEQVHSLRSSIPSAPANFKLREDNLSGSSIKAPRSFFSLSSFRSKGSEAKPR